MDVIRAQHRELLGLCDAVAADPGRRALAQVLVATTVRHLSAEAQYLYPAVRRVVPGGARLADREIAEDRGLLARLGRLDRTRPGAPGFAGAATAVAAAVRRHVAADARELLPALARMVPVEDLVRVGNRLETAVEAAPTRAHPRTPSTPPWNKVVDPAIAVLDKIRDVAGRRTTYPRDLDPPGIMSDL
ncbi:hemerythrin [Mangrovihabitans endophyticus]|uniref:Hemerythrin n=1 Tax=Mangrovihabitans endophyticus TaxID=1751298 RepID=A0A8J3FQU3_9ACTN|nr:hemerythrin [Mangrovihabitans endophyticus]